MKNEDLDDKGQFKMRLDEEDAEEAPIITQAGDLRLEKLNTRVTMISILIPVLIVLVLVITYMDMKKRVTQTKNTGQQTAESLSQELESRFSTLTMTQKAIEENLERLKDQSNKSVAKVQINLKKLDDRLKSTTKKMASQADIKNTKVGLDQSIGNVARTIDELKVQLGQITETLQPQISNLENSLSENKAGMAQLESQLAGKIDKEKMDVALKLEMLKIKQAYKDQLEDLQIRLKSVERKVAKRATAAPPSPTATPPPPEPSSPAPTSPSTSSPPGQLEEQTIGK